MTERKLPPIHPGEILLEEFLKPMKISQYRLAKDIGVPPRRINEIVKGLRAISRIQHSGCRATSAWRSGSGAICRRAMTSRSRRIGSWIGLNGKCESTLRYIEAVRHCSSASLPRL